MTPLILAVAAVLATAADASQAPSQTQTTTTTQEGTKPAPDPNKVICKDEELTGSRFTRHVCKTRAQWEAQEQAAANYKRTIDDRNGLQGAQSGPFGQ